MNIRSASCLCQRVKRTDFLLFDCRTQFTVHSAIAHSLIYSFSMGKLMKRSRVSLKQFDNPYHGVRRWHLKILIFQVRPFALEHDGYAF